MQFSEYSNSSSYVINTETATNKTEVFKGEPVPLENRVRLAYGDNPEAYLSSGKRDVSRMLDVLKQSNLNIESGSKILDFGCGSARMLRWLPEMISGCDYWGCDSEAKSIVWAQNNLSESLKLFTNLREPHLPFEDGYFDYIFAGSVFSHIDDLADSWLLELKRITAHHGILYLTFQDSNSLQLIKGRNTAAKIRYFKTLYEDNSMGELERTNYSKIVISKTNYSCQVFYQQEWLKKHLSKFFSDVLLVNEGYGWQTAAILKNQRK